MKKEDTLYGLPSPGWFRTHVQTIEWKWEFANEIAWTSLFTIFDNGGHMETSVRRRENGLR